MHSVRDRQRQVDKEPERRQGVRGLLPSVSRPGIWTFSKDKEGVSRELCPAPGSRKALAKLTVPLHLAYDSPSASAGH